MRRGFTSVQHRSAFPRWPIETSLHDLLDLVLGVLGEAAGAPVPWIAPWPAGYRAAVVLTHDVEQQVGYDNIHRLRDLELEHRDFVRRGTSSPAGTRSATTSSRSSAPRDSRSASTACYHDGRDLESERMLRRRLPEMREWAERWHAVGFRSPATHRAWELMPRLGFDYDSSYPDTDPYEPVAGGCCSWLPFMNGELVELPITLPQDHTLYEILRVPAARALVREGGRGRRPVRDGAPDHASGLHARRRPAGRLPLVPRSRGGARRRLARTAPRGERLVAPARLVVPRLARRPVGGDRPGRARRRRRLRPARTAKP